MRELDKVLDNNEKVFWEGKPNFWPFIISRSAIVIIIGIIFLGFLIPFMSIGRLFFGKYVFLTPHLWIGIIVVLGVPIYNLLLYKNIYYAITNKRVLIQTGLIGRDFQMIDFDQITDAEVNVGLFDKLFSKSSGSILISTAGSFTYGKYGPIPTPYTLSNVPNPYDVFKFFKKVSHAVKTDINYPNRYRPKVNPGYRTDYNPNKTNK